MQRRPISIISCSRIVRREGVGDILAEGARSAGQALGIPQLAPEVKGLEFPAYDPRVSPGMALAYMTSDRGACHLRTYPFGREASGVLPWFSLEQKAEFVKRQLPDGMGAGHVLSRADQDWLLDCYYHLRGWDARGLPTRVFLARRIVKSGGIDE